MPHIRRARPRDARAIARVHVDSWQTAYLGLVPAAILNQLTVDDRTTSWQRILGSRASGTWVVEADGAIVGFASAGPNRDDDAETHGGGEIYAIYLTPAFWGRGLGFELMQSALEDLRSRRVRVVTLWVLAGNTRARRFYEQCGFSLDGGEKVEHLGGAVLPEVRYRLLLE